MKKIILSIGAIFMAFVNGYGQLLTVTKVYNKVIGNKIDRGDYDDHPLKGLILMLLCIGVIIVIPWYYIYKKTCKKICEDIDEIYDENEEWFD